MQWLTSLAGFCAPLFLILSPILSYSDQALSMYRNKSSVGFSLDIPLIMLVASFFRIFYYPGARFDSALLIQSFLMVIMQVLLLKIALDHRPGPASKGGDAALPFAGAAKEGLWERPRPYSFWQWRSPKPYWQFLLYLFITLTALELILAPFTGLYAMYSVLLGYIGLSVEATLPLPQIFSNMRSRSCKGFRVSVLASWLAGDTMKMFWFFTSTTQIPWAFKLCGIFQACCDAFLGIQYLMYGGGEQEHKLKAESPLPFDHPMEMKTTLSVPPANGTANGRRTPFEKSLQ
ncbi:hypothetical protein N0V82_007693 [Gnomoniopsis sp. IMI 355080]|nr:hypothetical protein N0V82_007693 [Gnomoniopsis sp. IMI 355080]